MQKYMISVNTHNTEDTKELTNSFTCMPHGTSLQSVSQQQRWALSFSRRLPLWQIIQYNIMSISRAPWCLRWGGCVTS